LSTEVTGIDFSEVAVAETPKREHNFAMNTPFETCEVHDIPDRYSEQFDLVFRSHGVLTSLPALVAWAHQFAARLKPTGRVYLSVDHPLMCAFAESKPIQGLE